LGRWYAGTDEIDVSGLLAAALLVRADTVDRQVVRGMRAAMTLEGSKLGFSRMTTERSVAELLEAAGEGDQGAWNALVDRYGRLVWSVIRGFRLDQASAADVSQTVWLRLVENCHRIREPERLPAWLATTAKNESIRTLRMMKRSVPTEFELDLEDSLAPPIDEGLLTTERNAQVLAAFRKLPAGDQQLLELLTADPPLDYETIASMIDRPIGSIGPTRARCLERLRRLLELEELGMDDAGDERG
jgi:RNA polymerase sigma factor (sigma-70 family)